MVVVVVVESSPTTLPMELTFDAEEVVSLGRDPSSHVQLPDASVSLRHALLRPSASGPLLVDQNSTNGTWLNSVRLVAGGGKQLSDGDQIRLGRARVQIHFRTRSRAPAGELSTQDIALAMVQGALLESGTAVSPRLNVVEGPARGAELTLDQERSYVIGRDPDADLTLDDDDVSRRHVSVVRRGSRLWVMDLGSRNGSRLDGRMLEPHVAVVWSDTAVLELGQSSLCIDDPVSSALRRLESVPDEPLGSAPPTAARQADSTQMLRSQSASRSGDGAAAPAPEGSTPFSSVSEAKGVLKLSTSSSSSAPSAPIAVLARQSQPPSQLAPKGRKKARWSALDALVVGVAVVTIALSALALAWFLVS